MFGLVQRRRNICDIRPSLQPYTDETTAPAPPDMSIQAVAKYIGANPSTVRNMIADGRLRAYKLEAASFGCAAAALAPVNAV